jgi:hypothetical protein
VGRKPPRSIGCEELELDEVQAAIAYFLEVFFLMISALPMCALMRFLNVSWAKLEYYFI